MADLEKPPGLGIRVEWESALGVKTPELAETWARLSIWVGGKCITSVEDRAGAFRRSVYTSAYPLAEWISFNWWALTSEIRPSAVASGAWAWANIADFEWLARHNLRAAGNGMPWPDLTLVAEGSLTRAVWRAGPGLANQPITFVSEGHAFLRTEETVNELARFVEQTIDRLRDAGISDTPLSKEWQAIREADDEESEFSRAAARLGLDPYSMDERAKSDLLGLAEHLSSPLLDEFLDSANLERSRDGLMLTLVVDIANVMGSRPDGWWRDRAGAATRLMASLVPLVGRDVVAPISGVPSSTRVVPGTKVPAGSSGELVRIDRIIAVVEGRARTATAPPELEVELAPADGDTTIVAAAERVLAEGDIPLVITADRGLRDGLPAGSRIAGPGWLLALL